MCRGYIYFIIFSQVPDPDQSWFFMKKTWPTLWRNLPLFILAKGQLRYNYCFTGSCFLFKLGNVVIGPTKHKVYPMSKHGLYRFSFYLKILKPRPIVWTVDYVSSNSYFTVAIFFTTWWIVNVGMRGPVIYIGPKGPVRECLVVWRRLNVVMEVRISKWRKGVWS